MNPFEIRNDKNTLVDLSVLKTLDIDSMMTAPARSGNIVRKTATGKNFNDGESLRKAGDYEDALKVFEELLDEQPSADLQWRIAYCYRHIGLNGIAMLLAGAGIVEWPEDRLLRSEYVWANINALLKPAVEAKNHVEVIKVAEKIISYGADSLALRKVFFEAVEAAKALNRWDIVVIFVESVRVENFPAVAPKDGKSNWSDAERYYMSAVKAYYTLEDFTSCRQVALEAAARFKTRYDFHRFAALALQKSGEPENALAEMLELKSRARLPWYFIADIASLQHCLGHDDQALQNAVEAVSMNGIPATKINLFELLGEIYQLMQMQEAAGVHFALAASIRISNGWKVSERLAANCFEGGIEPVENWKELFKRAASCWTGNAKAAPASTERCNGVINYLNTEKNFGFIKPSAGGKIFFRPSENSGIDCVEGLAVSFCTRSSFDRVKQKESLSAFDLKVVA